MIVRHSVFPGDPWGDGGARRTAQIGEILKRSGIAAPFLLRPAEVGRFASLASFAREAGFLCKRGLPLRLRRELVKGFGRDLPAFRRQLAALPAGSLLLWEGTKPEFAHLGHLAREAGVRVIGLPHNLESLVPESRSFCSGRLAPGWLDEEVRSLSACDAVFAISREDQWLLRLHGIQADYLPYHPATVVERFLSEIRAVRQTRPQGEDLLLLGTAGNPPTLAGMANRLEFFSRNRRLFSRLHVAGYGTEPLRDTVGAGDAIQVHGAVENQRLCELLVGVRAAVVHQQATSGALTRIPELLLAGVPVLANVDAARSYFRMPGIHVYENDAQLTALLSAPLIANEVPSHPSAFERIFTERIRGLSATGKQGG